MTWKNKIKSNQNITSLPLILECIRLTSSFCAAVTIGVKKVLSAVLESAAKACLHEQVRNKNGAVTMLSGS
ncbi:hypothetical protein AERO8C_50052 [Aeromonas veronii]|uniref:Uncharacterized protein n=1 Tax=Aeromonas veronii TaxID=654 RepID=A0A653L6N4_AERVE|nr:hypothetical protein AERO8C_50052 [Aeromonas veronii]